MNLWVPRALTWLGTLPVVSDVPSSSLLTVLLGSFETCCKGKKCVEEEGCCLCLEHIMTRIYGPAALDTRLLRVCA